MKLILLLGFALFSLAQASPIPIAEAVGGVIKKSYTLPDGTVVYEVVEHDDGKTIVIKRFTKRQLVKVDKELDALPRARIIQNPSGHSNVLSIPANVLYNYLISKGFKFPAVPEDPFFGDNPDRQITVYITQLYKLLANVDQLNDIPPNVAARVLKTRPTLQVKSTEVLDAKKPRTCRNGLIATAGNLIAGTATGIVGNVADLFGSGLLGDVAQGANDLVSDVVGGANDALKDAACGLEDIADTAASALDTGNVVDIVEGAGAAVDEVVSGVGNIANDIVGGVAHGLNDVAKNLLQGIADLL